MAKLLVSEREYIAKHIIDDATKVLSEKMKELQSYMMAKLEKDLPKNIKEIKNLYPDVIKEDYISYGRCQVLKDLSKYSLYLSIYYVPYKDLDFVQIFDTDFWIQDKKNKIIELRKKITTIQNKTKCILEHINTHKQLKDQFPEAYNVLTGMTPEENQCDSTENLRAELNSFKKS